MKEKAWNVDKWRLDPAAWWSVLAYVSTDKELHGEYEKYKFEILPHPTYLPELSPCDFFLVPTIKKSMSGVKFETDNEIKEASAAALYQLQDTSFQMSFQQLQHRWIKAINSEGPYFEGDWVYVLLFCLMWLN